MRHPSSLLKSELKWGGLDILAADAGSAPQGSFLELSDEDWPAGFGLKMFANLRVVKETWPMLKAASGHLVMIGGITARAPEQHLSLVSAVNGGVAALSKSVAEQGLLDGVHLNLVQPGTIQTSRRKKLMEKLAGQASMDYATYLREVPKRLRIDRLGEPSDVAEDRELSRHGRGQVDSRAIIDIDGGQNKGI